jgi:hypothetical protein
MSTLKLVFAGLCLVSPACSREILQVPLPIAVMVRPETRQIDVAVLDDISKGSPLEEKARIS